MVNDGRVSRVVAEYIFIAFQKEAWPRSPAAWNDRKSMANESSIINSRHRCRRHRFHRRVAE